MLRKEKSKIEPKPGS